jgi:hypothetical protein
MMIGTRGSERMEIRAKDYSAGYDATTQTVSLQGTLRLAGAEEYAPITQLLEDAAAQPLSQLTLNLRGLQFLNSSGINMLSKLVIKVRQRGNIQLVILGNNTIPWQGKSLKNLQRLMPSLQLELE